LLKEFGTYTLTNDGTFNIIRLLINEDDIVVNIEGGGGGYDNSGY